MSKRPHYFFRIKIILPKRPHFFIAKTACLIFFSTQAMMQNKEKVINGVN
jgi:hypothetical protein